MLYEGFSSCLTLPINCLGKEQLQSYHKHFVHPPYFLCCMVLKSPLCQPFTSLTRCISNKHTIQNFSHCHWSQEIAFHAQQSTCLIALLHAISSIVAENSLACVICPASIATCYVSHVRCLSIHMPSVISLMRQQSVAWASLNTKVLHPYACHVLVVLTTFAWFLTNAKCCTMLSPHAILSPLIVQAGRYVPTKPILSSHPCYNVAYVCQASFSAHILYLLYCSLMFANIVNFFLLKHAQPMSCVIAAAHGIVPIDCIILMVICPCMCAYKAHHYTFLMPKAPLSCL